MNKQYYEINEDLAEQAKNSYSQFDYIKNSATEEYKKEVDYIYELAESIKNVNGIDIQEKLQCLCDKYAKKLADWINRKNSSDSNHVSWAIAGPANYNMKKHNQWETRTTKLFEEGKQIDNIIEEVKDLRTYKPKVAKQGVVNNNYNFTNDFFEVVQNEEENRIQLFFDGKPNEEIRNLLKHNGFRWSSKNVCWQRQLTANARMTVRYIINELKGE